MLVPSQLYLSLSKAVVYSIIEKKDKGFENGHFAWLESVICFILT